MTSAVQYRNVAAANASGFNAAIEGAALSSRLRYGATLTAAYARFQESAASPNQLLTAAPQVSGNARISYEIGGAWPTLALAGRFVGSRAADGAFSGDYHPEPYAPLLTEVRAAVSGKVPWVRGLGYRASANYVSTRYSPYTIGPGSLPSGAGELLPVDQFRTTVGLSYDRGL